MKLNISHIFLMFALVTGHAYAGGFLTVKVPLFNACTGNICNAAQNLQASLLIMEPLTKNLEFKSWSGYVPTFWAESDNGIFYKVNEKMKVGAEVDYSHSMVPNFQSDYMSLRGVLELKLW